MPEQSIDDLVDLSQQIVLYQKMEDRWGDLDEMIELEEGEFLVESGNQIEEENFLEAQSREIQAFDPLFSQDDNAVLMNEPLILEAVKENGETSKQKPNQRKRAEKKSNIKGVETRSSKLEQHTKVNPKALTLEKSGKRTDQHSKVKPDVGSPDKAR